MTIKTLQNAVTTASEIRAWLEDARDEIDEEADGDRYATFDEALNMAESLEAELEAVNKLYGDRAV